ncbi:MAG: hypothetical protein LQ343_005860 [Gyalolechia ehrenbergii]|nr:MAG: hypothetical protein LQ343_005860 [Gyalolechia ehrenbergii]
MRIYRDVMLPHLPDGLRPWSNKATVRWHNATTADYLFTKRAPINFATAKGISEIDADLEEKFTNEDGVQKEPLGGEYGNRNIPAGKAFVSYSNHGPTYFTTKKLNTNDATAIQAAIPRMHDWADIVWAIWQEKAGTQAGDLQYTLHNTIAKLSTRQLMELIEGIEADEVIRELKLPWPGHSYNIGTPQGLTLLGSRHGVRIAWLYINGRKALGLRNSIQVTIFT